MSTSMILMIINYYIMVNALLLEQSEERKKNKAILAVLVLDVQMISKFAKAVAAIFFTFVPTYSSWHLSVLAY